MSNSIATKRINYRITSADPNAPQILASILYGEDNHLTGFARTTFGPRKAEKSFLQGQFHKLATVDTTEAFLVLAVGYPVRILPVQPIAVPANLELKMTLNGNLSAGKADVRVRDAEGQWITLRNLSVEEVHVPEQVSA